MARLRYNPASALPDRAPGGDERVDEATQQVYTLAS